MIRVMYKSRKNNKKVAQAMACLLYTSFLQCIIMLLKDVCCENGGIITNDVAVQTY